MPLSKTVTLSSDGPLGMEFTVVAGTILAQSDWNPDLEEVAFDGVLAAVVDAADGATALAIALEGALATALDGRLAVALAGELATGLAPEVVLELEQAVSARAGMARAMAPVAIFTVRA